MKSYWDFTEKERSEMTQEQVESLFDIELMEKGVLKVTPPVLKEIQEVSLKKIVYHKIGSLLFETAEQAQKVLEMKPLREEYDYNGAGYNYKYTVKVHEESIQESLYDKNDIKSLNEILQQNNLAKEHNERVTEEYNEACEKVHKVLNTIWNDWYRCKELKDKYKKVLETREEYLTLSGGNALVSRKFLSKVFNETEITKAEEWFGVLDETKL